MPSDLAVGIFAWQRPEYLTRCLDSLAANDLTGVDVHLFQDGAVCAYTDIQRGDPGNVKESLRLFEKAEFPRKELHLQSKNVGLAAQRLFMMPYLARRYRWFMSMDDDAVLSPHAIHLLKVLLLQFEEDDSIGCVFPGFRPLCIPERAHEHESSVYVADNVGHWWATAYWGRKWVKYQEATYLRYCDFVLPYPYIEHYHYKAEVMAWAEALGTKVEASSDTALLRTMQVNKQLQAQPVLNRATGIGERGIHSTPELFAKIMDANRPYHVSDSELGIKIFQCVDGGSLR